MMISTILLILNVVYHIINKVPYISYLNFVWMYPVEILCYIFIYLIFLIFQFRPEFYQFLMIQCIDLNF